MKRPAAVVAGGFEEPMPERCASPVAELVHVHGLDDAVVPPEGRPIGGRRRRADIVASFARFEGATGCTAAPDRVDVPGALHCRSWGRCDAGEPAPCPHAGGHSFALAPPKSVLGDG